MIDTDAHGAAMACLAEPGFEPVLGGGQARLYLAGPEVPWPIPKVPLADFATDEQAKKLRLGVAVGDDERALIARWLDACC
mmetsp:Transcript_117174/g.184321  ORF Transcript_117174/g.184321 Transcript_117174/m.184321 type:complete len:81 (-) Transcript_117174:13-255(-)